jgi:hypothetical protein
MTGLMSFGVGGAFISSFLLVVEIVDTRYRWVFSMVLWFHWGTSYIMVNIAVNTFTTWREIYILMLLVNVILLAVAYLTHESPRALAANMGQFHVARMILRKMSSYNH